jgi:hypothetical protein
MTPIIANAFAVYSIESGDIRMIVRSSADHAEAQVRDGEAVAPVSAEVSGASHRIDPTTGLAELLPPREPSSGEVLEEDRAHRDRLLAASDWTQASDNRLTPEQRTAWADVREQWRGRIDDLKAGRPPRPWADEPK